MAGTFNQSLQCTQDVFVGFQAPLPPVEGTECTPRTLDSLIDRLGQQIGPVWIVTGGPSVLDVVATLESLEALHPSIVNILGIGDELRRRRRSVGSRHFDVEDGLMV